tara:strand:+ start:69 stop:404 length:336 start_codon:yes stop_codon:yes gene_type:complete
MPNLNDYLGTLAVNLRLAAEAAEALRQSHRVLIPADNDDLIRNDILNLERAAIAFRAKFDQAARQSPCQCPENESLWQPKHRGECGFFGTTPNPDCRCHNAPFPVVQEARA